MAGAAASARPVGQVDCKAVISRGALAVFTWVVVELVLLGWAVSVLGGWNVALLSVGAALLGLGLIRRGVGGLLRSGSAVPAPGLRSRPVSDRAMLGLAGILLITPGLLSGVVGALLVVPPIRAAVGSRISSRVAQFVVPVASPFDTAFGGFGRHNDVVDVDLVNEEDITKTARGRQGPSELR